MNAKVTKGNNPELWQRLLDSLDEKLQLNLLGHLQKISAYHFEDDVLFIDPGSPEEEEFFRRDSVFQQLQLLAQDAVKVDRVKIKSPK